MKTKFVCMFLLSPAEIKEQSSINENYNHDVHIKVTHTASMYWQSQLPG